MGQTAMFGPVLLLLRNLSSQRAGQKDGGRRNDLKYNLGGKNEASHRLSGQQESSQGQQINK